MRRTALIAATILSCGTTVHAQDAIEMPIREVLALSAQPFLDRDSFQGALNAALRGVRTDAGEIDPPVLDPFLWAISGSFGPNGTRTVPGAIFACARYGLSTREFFAEQGFSTWQSFQLMGRVIPQTDDTNVWPEGAVARLFCSFVWDDERVVLILPEAPARAALNAVFEQVIIGSTSADVYRMDATLGPDDSVAQVESATVILTQGHQSVTFRSFLMGGGS